MTKKYVLKNNVGLEMYIEVEDGGGVSFYRSFCGHYTPQDTKKEIANLYFSYKNKTWLNSVCKALNLIPEEVIKLGIDNERRRKLNRIRNLEHGIQEATIEISNIKYYLEQLGKK